MRNPHKKPRVAHCIGCGVTFDKMHLMINHRRRERCGGRFLPEDERELLEACKAGMRFWDITGIKDLWVTAQANLREFNNRRKKRIYMQNIGKAPAGWEAV